MVYSWRQPDASDGFHPRLDPVTAWLARRNSPFLRATDTAGDAASLFSMPIGADGFRPDIRHAWRALGVPNPGGPGAGDFTVFTSEELDTYLSPIARAFTDPRVHVLPLVAGGALPADLLRERRAIGSPHTNDVRFPLTVPPRAIVGVLDYGINIFHHRFRHGAGGTRVCFAWMQDQPRHQGRLAFGAEWQRSDIEAALAADGGDEDLLLARIGADFSVPGRHPLGQHTTHGTHVLDLAAGFEPDDPAGESLPIIAVSLPSAVTRETSGSMLALPFALGLEYIADRARHVMREAGTVVPVIVNFSFGLTGGPRRGQHRLEQTIDRIAEHHRAEMGTAEATFQVVLAAGNGNLAQGYASAPAGGAPLEVGWHLQPADPSANVLEIRAAPVPEDAASGALSLAVTLTPPQGAALPTITLDLNVDAGLDTVWLLERRGTVIGRLTGQRAPDGTGGVTLVLDATDPGPLARVVAPSGEWRVHVSSAAPVPHHLDAWVLRDDVPRGFGDAGRQSYLVDAAYRTRDALGRLVTEDSGPEAQVRRTGSLNTLATATALSAHRVVVGGYVGATGQPAPYSAAPLPGSAERVDVSAVSDRSGLQAGVQAAGTRSGSRATMSGTSVAAPQLTRRLATSEVTLAAPGSGASPRLGARLPPN